MCIGNLYSRYLSLTRDRIVYTTRIVLKIGPRGRVRRVEIAYGPSAAFGYAGIDCFCGISLPAPEGGSVTISVPIVLSPPAFMRPLRP